MSSVCKPVVGLTGLEYAAVILHLMLWVFFKSPTIKPFFYSACRNRTASPPPTNTKVKMSNPVRNRHKPVMHFTERTLLNVELKLN